MSKSLLADGGCPPIRFHHKEAFGHFLVTFYSKSFGEKEAGQTFKRLTCEYVVEHRGIEPLTSGLQNAIGSLNRRSVCSGREDAGALTCGFSNLGYLCCLEPRVLSTFFGTGL